MTEDLTTRRELEADEDERKLQAWVRRHAQSLARNAGVDVEYDDQRTLKVEDGFVVIPLLAVVRREDLCV